MGRGSRPACTARTPPAVDTTTPRAVAGASAAAELADTDAAEDDDGVVACDGVNEDEVKVVVGAECTGALLRRPLSCSAAAVLAETILLAEVAAAEAACRVVVI
jgi:hypothetical protein